MEKVYLPIGPGSNVTIDWGDGSPLESFTGDGSENYNTLHAQRLAAVDFENLYIEDISSFTESELDAIYLIGDIPNHVYDDSYTEETNGKYDIIVYGTVSYYHCQCISMLSAIKHNSIETLLSNIRTSLISGGNPEIPYIDESLKYIIQPTVSAIYDIKTPLPFNAPNGNNPNSILHNGTTTEFEYDPDKPVLIPEGDTWVGINKNIFQYGLNVETEMGNIIELYVNNINVQSTAAGQQLALNDPLIGPVLNGVIPHLNVDDIDFTDLDVQTDNPEVMSKHNLRGYFLDDISLINDVRVNHLYPLTEGRKYSELWDYAYELADYLDLRGTIFEIYYPRIASHGHFHEYMAYELPTLLEYTLTTTRKTSITATSGNTYDVNPNTVTFTTDEDGLKYEYLYDYRYTQGWYNKSVMKLGYDTVSYLSDTNFSFGLSVDVSSVQHGIQPYADWDMMLCSKRMVAIGIEAPTAFDFIYNINYTMESQSPFPTNGIIVNYYAINGVVTISIIAFGTSNVVTTANDSDSSVFTVGPGFHVCNLTYEGIDVDKIELMIDYDSVNKTVRVSNGTTSIYADVVDQVKGGDIISNLSLTHVALTGFNDIHGLNDNVRTDDQSLTIHKDADLNELTPLYPALVDVQHQSVTNESSENFPDAMRGGYVRTYHNDASQYEPLACTVLGNQIYTYSSIYSTTLLKDTVEGKKYQLEFEAGITLSTTMFQGEVIQHRFEFDGSRVYHDNEYVGSIVIVRVLPIVYVGESGEHLNYVRFEITNLLSKESVSTTGPVAYADVSMDSLDMGETARVLFNVLVDHDTGRTEVVTSIPYLQMFTVNDYSTKVKTNVNSITSGANTGSDMTTLNFKTVVHSSGAFERFTFSENRDSSTFQNPTPEYSGEIDISTGLVNAIDIDYP